MSSPELFNIAADRELSTQDVAEVYAAISWIILQAYPENGDDEVSTDPMLGALRQIRMETFDGSSLMIRSLLQETATPSRERANAPLLFCVDAHLDPGLPNAVTRFMLQGSQDDEPHRLSAFTSFFGPTGGDTHTVELREEQLDYAFRHLRSRLAASFFVPSELSDAFHIPEEADSVLGPEAEMAQEIIGGFMAAEEVVAADIEPATPVRFSVWDANDYRDPLTITHANIKSLDPSVRGTTGTVTTLLINRLDNETDRPLAVQICDTADRQPEVHFFERHLGEITASATHIALGFAIRHRIYRAMRRQLLGGKAVRLLPQDKPTEA